MSSSDSDNAVGPGKGRRDDNDLQPIVLPGPAASPALLIETIKNAQQQIQILKERNVKLRHENGVLRSKAQRASGSAKVASNSIIAEHQDRIVLLGKKWAIMHDPWIDNSAFMCALSDSVPEPFSTSQFVDEESYKEGYVAELHHYLEEESAPDLKELAQRLPAFKDEFMKQIGNERSVILNTIRKNAALIFSDIEVSPLLWSVSSSKEQAESAIIKSLLYMPNESLDDTPFLLVFYPNQNIKSRDIFFNEYQPRLIRIALFGPNSLQTAVDQFKYSSMLLGMKWRVTEVNASCIAWSAVVLRFILSPDTQFSERGSVSQINYQKCFFEYRQMIVQNELDSRSTYVRQLFSFYNQHVFPGLSKASGPGSGHGTTSEAHTNAMAVMMEQMRMESPSPELVLTSPHVSSDNNLVTTDLTETSEDHNEGAGSMDVTTMATADVIDSGNR
ncbi:hypothetical protein VKT23_020579 [Stygiomarasmius scandens]|uniref:Uncharacterized protein n=1 Tax=Marasmiellus scandens TaxID=2682957 RepID=A0ABR1IIQ3_9AGAR